MLSETRKIIAKNKKATYDYFIEDEYECGIALLGTEIKAVRAGKVQLRDSYARIIKGEVFAMAIHISQFEFGNRFNHEPLRVRKLLLHRKEIDRLTGLTKEKGYALIPLRIYLQRGLAKVSLGLAKGKKNYDKRQVLKAKDATRTIERALRERQK